MSCCHAYLREDWDGEEAPYVVGSGHVVDVLFDLHQLGSAKGHRLHCNQRESVSAR
jgi:hypothetical protein